MLTQAINVMPDLDEVDDDDDDLPDLDDDLLDDKDVIKDVDPESGALVDEFGMAVATGTGAVGGGDPNEAAA